MFWRISLLKKFTPKIFPYVSLLLEKFSKLPLYLIIPDFPSEGALVPSTEYVCCEVCKIKDQKIQFEEEEQI